MSRPSPLRTLAAPALLALACAHGGGGPAPGAASAGPVTLAFRWPDGFQSHVLIAHESRRRGAEPTGLVARQRMVAERQGDEIRVFTRDLVARGDEPDLETNVKVNQALVQVVAPDGRFRRAEGLDQALEALEASGATDRERARQALVRSTALDWELLVGAWAGQRLAPGELHRKRLQAYVPHLALVEAALDVEYELEGRVPCTEEETDRRCVALSYRARLAPEDRAQALERLRRATTGGADQPVAEDVHGEVDVLLVTEPETLVPHRMTQRERLRIRLRLPDGRVLETEDRSEDTDLFSDREPAPPPSEATPRSL